jgi:hypothetical protein
MGFIFALVIGLFLGGTAGYLGTLMLSQRMALVAGPLGHLTLPGIALALIFNFDVSLGAFPFVILGIFLIWLFEMNTKLPMEALTAIVFATGVAITFLFLPEEKTVPALIGDISQINLPATLISVILSLLVFFVTKKIYPQMILAGISEDLAKAQRINLKKYHFLYLLCIALTVALGGKNRGWFDDRGFSGHPGLRCKKCIGESGSVFFRGISLWESILYFRHGCVSVYGSSDRAINCDCEYFLLPHLLIFQKMILAPYP